MTPAPTKRVWIGTSAGLLVLFFCLAGSAQEPAIRESAVNLLVGKCAVCHGAAQTSGLDVRQRETLLKGGSRGAAIVPGKAEESLLYRAASHQGELKMPPGSSASLPAEELEILKQWINEGAGWPVGQTTLKTSPEPSWWSFKKLRRPSVPRAADPQSIANPIDAFILAKLQEKGLRPAPRADKQTLLRRAYFDLTGLPPAPEQTDRFLADSSPEAYQKIIDELLASPRYGERWARHWLDVVRYADSAGFEGDVYYPNAWRYRDYVIKSFNEDKPYDRFVQEQIAGDELWPDNLELAGFYDVPYEKLEHLEAQIGTAVYTFGPEIQESHLDGGKLRYERLTDAVDMTASAFLGLSLGCARCHDHKFDPFPQKDYFRLQAIFAASHPVQIPVVTSLSATHRDEAYHWMIALDEARLAFGRLERTVKDRVIADEKKHYAPEVVHAYEVPPEKRTARQAELANPLVKFYNDIKIEQHFTENERELHRELNQRMAKTVLDVPREDGSHRVRFDGFFDLPTATVLGHLDLELIPETHVLNRGDFGKNKTKVAPGVPAILNDGSEPPSSDGARHGQSDLAGSLRPRHRRNHERLWKTGPASDPSGTAGLAGYGLHSARLEHQIDAAAHHALEHLSNVESLYRCRQQPHRCRESLSLAHESKTSGSRGYLGLDSCRCRNAQPQDERTSGHAAPYQCGKGRSAGEALVGPSGRSLFPGAIFHFPCSISSIGQIRQRAVPGVI